MCVRASCACAGSRSRATVTWFRRLAFLRQSANTSVSFQPALIEAMLWACRIAGKGGTVSVELHYGDLLRLVGVQVRCLPL